MAKAYIGDLPVDGCAIGDVAVDASFLGDVAVCETVSPKRLLEIKITSPTRPVFNHVLGGVVIIDDNNDGTWDCWSYDPITKLDTVARNFTAVAVVTADTLTDVSNAWTNGSKLTSFDCTGLTAVLNISSAWEGCIALASFDTAGLSTAVTCDRAWARCNNLVSFDASHLTSATSIEAAWSLCKSLVSFDTTGLGSVTNCRSPWNGCDALTSFDASGLVSAVDIWRAWRTCRALASFVGGGALLAVRNAEEALDYCTGLICIDELDSTLFTNKNKMLPYTSTLVAPDKSTQTLLKSAAGFAYVNPNPCPKVIVYDAYVIGGSLSGNITISPFIQADGVTEETSMQGIDFLDGVERSLILHYQNGVNDNHIGMAAPFNLAVDFNNNYVIGTNIEPMFNIADSPFKGEWVIQVVASGVEVRVKYDAVKGKLYADWS